MPQGRTRADLCLSSAVVRDEESNFRIENQMKVTVEVFCVPSMSDDAVAAARFFVETECHSVH